MKVKIFRFVGQRIAFLVLARQFFIGNLSLSIFPPIFVVRVLLSVLLTALDRIRNKSALFLNDLKFIFG
ncbi:hypothetical protein NC651_007901 [Populus alba x Populus x berolinensis]|nr:hypothetical protein NC651_007901 [Populus alba x Populus x berolinensis]